jgi:hypothetical protein
VQTVAMISAAEKRWRDKINDPTLTDAQRDEAAIKYDRIVKRRQKTKKRGPYNKTVPEEPMYSPFDGESLRDYRARHDEWARRYPKAAGAADAERAANGQRLVGHDAPVVSMPTPKPVAKPAPAPESKPARPTVLNEADAWKPSDLERALDRSANVIRDGQPRPTIKPVVQPHKFPMLPGATDEESKSCWLLDGWGNRMTIAEREKHVANRDAYDARMTAKREAEKAALIASLPLRDVKAEERARQEQQAAEQRIQIRAEQPPAFSEPNRGNPMSAVELQKLTQPTMQNSDGGISVEPDKRRWLPDLAVSLAQHLSTERRTELVKEPVLAVVVLST